MPVEGVAAELAYVAVRIDRLLASAPAAERLREGALLVLAGRPNAGKSSLFNALLGTERALVTEVPGTTRDAVEAQTEFLGWPVRLVDTAGLWDAPGRIDRLGIEVSRRYLAAADLILLCLETGRAADPDDREILEDGRALAVRTKSDLDGRDPGVPGAVPVSALTGDGLDALRRAAAARLFGERIALGDLEPALTRARHRTALLRAQAALAESRAQLHGANDPVLVAHHLRDATTALDELVGAVDIEDILDRVFATFCVGK